MKPTIKVWVRWKVCCEGDDNDIKFYVDDQLQHHSWDIVSEDGTETDVLFKHQIEKRIDDKVKLRLKIFEEDIIYDDHQGTGEDRYSVRDLARKPMTLRLVGVGSYWQQGVFTIDDMPKEPLPPKWSALR